MNILGSEEAVNYMYSFFDDHLDIIKKLDNMIVKYEGNMWVSLIPLLYSIKDSSDTMGILIEKGKLRDSYIIARTIFETVVNACFICAEGEEAAEKSRRYAKQKAYRDLERELEIDSRILRSKWMSKDFIHISDELRSAIEEYTNKSGKEITSWTQESVKKKIEKISQKYGFDVGVKLQFGLFFIYRHASEIAHGSVFGALYILGFTSPLGVQDSKSLRISQLEQSSTLFLMLGLSLSALIKVIEKESGEDKFSRESNDLLNELKKEAWLDEQQDIDEKE